MNNVLYTGDCLHVLHGTDSASVDLIYLDPPFNSKRTYSAPVGSKAAGASFKDMWTWQDVDEAYLERMIDSYPYLVQFIQSVQVIHGKAMMSYLTYMTQRIVEMHRVLKPTGSLYLHCDSTAGHYLKILMDAIFGRNNFRNDIVWRRNESGAKGSQHTPSSWGNNTDHILFYVNSGKPTFDPRIMKSLHDMDVKRLFPKIDVSGARFNSKMSAWCSPSMGARPNLCYTFHGIHPPYASGWRLSRERMEEEFSKGNIIVKNGMLERRSYERDYKGRSPGNLWTDKELLLGAQSKERTGYPTQKPLALLQRIIKASSNEGDVVLDPFCGCATTCVAAQQLNRQWIGIDIEQKAASILVERLSDDAGLFSDFVHRTDTPRREDVTIELPGTKSVKERLYKEQEGVCNGCRDRFEIRHLETDHVVPRSKGGGDYVENYQLLCGHCNRTKGSRPMEYLAAKVAARERHMKSQVTFLGKEI